MYIYKTRTTGAVQQARLPGAKKKEPAARLLVILVRFVLCYFL